METVTLTITGQQIASPFGPDVPTVTNTLYRDMRSRFPKRDPVRVASDIKPGDAIEFSGPPEVVGANRRKYHGLVTAISETEVTIERHRDDEPALAASGRWHRLNDPPAPLEWWQDGFKEEAASSFGDELAAG